MTRTVYILKCGETDKKAISKKAYDFVISKAKELIKTDDNLEICTDENGKPYVKDVWPGSALLYSKVEVPEGAKYFYVNAGVSGSYAGQEIVFSYYKTGDPQNTQFAKVVTKDNGWYADNDPIYVEIKDMPSGQMDVYAEFFTNGKTCNLYSFGFLSELPDDENK